MSTRRAGACEHPASLAMSAKSVWDCLGLFELLFIKNQYFPLLQSCIRECSISAAEHLPSSESSRGWSVASLFQQVCSAWCPSNHITRVSPNADLVTRADRNADLVTSSNHLHWSFYRILIYLVLIIIYLTTFPAECSNYPVRGLVHIGHNEIYLFGSNSNPIMF